MLYIIHLRATLNFQGLIQGNRPVERNIQRPSHGLRYEYSMPLSIVLRLFRIGCNQIGTK